MSEINRSNDDLLLEQEATTTELQTLNTNGAKEAKQDTMITDLGTIAGDTTSIDGKVSTEAKQDDIISELQDIEAALAGAGNTGTETTVAASATSVALVAANTARREIYIRNDSNKDMWIVYGATATATSAIKLKRGDILVEDRYTGQMAGIWDTAPTGNARINEVTKV